MSNVTILGPLFTDHLSCASVSGLWKALNQVDKYYKDLELKVNVNKAEIMFFLEGREVEEEWHFQEQEVVIGDKITYLGMVLHSTDKWNKQKNSPIEG